MTPARTVLAVLVPVVLAVLAVVGAVVPDAAAGARVAAGPAVAVPPQAGGVVCAVGDTADGGVVDLLVATPGAVAPGTEVVARTRAVVLGDRPARPAQLALPPGALAAARADVAPGGLVWVGWADAPAVVWREWRRSGAPGVPRGRTAAACADATAPTAHLVGLRTDGGNEARLRLANPYPFDATAAVTLVTRDGAAAPLLLRNLSVPAGGALDVRLNDHVPERSDVAVIVDVLAGRVAVEGLQVAVAGVGGVEGLAIVPAAPVAAPAWTLPWLPEGPDAVVWVLNPSNREVDVEVTVHAPDGPGLPPELDVVEVGPGRVVGIPAADLVPPGLGAVGVSLRSDTAPIVVGGALRVGRADPDVSGLTMLPALPAPDARWLLAGVAAADRSTRVHVVNVETRPVTVGLVLRTAAVTGPDVVERVLTSVRVPAGAHAAVPLPLEPGRAWALEVVADGTVVVVREGGGADAGQPVVAAGVPAAAWGPSPEAVAGVRRDGWTRTPIG